MHPSESEWNQFHDVVRRRTGIDLSQYKANQLRRRVIGMAEARGAKSLSEYAQRLDADEARLFLDKMAINVSELFRNPEKWFELRNKVLTELQADRRAIKCWSAGCSYGAEAHSLAILLAEHFPNSRHRIIGSDIDEAALAQARRGEFNDNDIRGVPKEYVGKYFTKLDGKWMAAPSLKPLLEFRRADLLAGSFETGFDLILCRNVVIYFNDDAKQRLYERFFQSLKPGGYLFVGGTERIFGSAEMGYENPLPFFYRKPTMEVGTWRSAS